MNEIDVLEKAGREFASRAASIGDDEWDAPTVCDGWTVAQLVDHVAGGSAMSTGLLAGGSREDAIAAIGGACDGDRLAALGVALAGELESFRQPGALEMTVQHPVLDMSGTQLIGFRTLDLALHAWDLAHSIDVDDTLDSDVVEALWAFLQPLAPIIGTLGLFGEGPSGTLGDETPLQDRLVDLTGRRW